MKIYRCHMNERAFHAECLKDARTCILLARIDRRGSVNSYADLHADIARSALEMARKARMDADFQRIP